MRAPRKIAAVGVAVLVAGGLTVTAAGARTSSASTAAPPSAHRGTVTAAEPAALTGARAAALSADVTDRVVVVFRDQLHSLPDSADNSRERFDAVDALQTGVLDELTRTHAREVRSIRLVNAIAATVSPGEASRLAADPAVAEVVPDEPIRLAGPARTLPGARDAAGGTPLPGACAPAGQVQLDPQAIETIHAATQSGAGAAAQSLGYTGAGVKVGFIADGLDIDNPDFIRPDGRHVFVDYRDFSGTGTTGPTAGGEAFLDASSIAAQGRETYDVSGYGLGLNRPCDIRVLGVAPGASLVGLNTYGTGHSVYDSVLVEAIDYAVTTDHVDVLNESFGADPFPDTGSLDLIRLADRAAVAAGVVVTSSTGDAGVTNTIGSPATDPEVLSVGATTTYRAYAQAGLSGTTNPGVTGWLDDNISGLSSAGFEQSGATVDVVAPGDSNWALCTADLTRFQECSDFAGRPAAVELTGGTSESSPLTAGVAALVIQAYRGTHHGRTPSPAVVKKIIVSTAQDIAAPADQQGAGLVDAYQAVRAAASYAGASTAAVGNAVLDSATQLNAVAQPGTGVRFEENLTNDGTAPVHLSLSSRTLGTYTPLKSTTVTLDPKGGLTFVHFRVPPGRARLDASIAYRARGPSTDYAGLVTLKLYSPRGQLAEDADPQGTGNHVDAEVANPAPGTWSALVVANAPAADGGTSGQVHFGVSAASWVPFGQLSTRVFTLAPRATRSVVLTVATPATPGDEAGSIVLRRSADRSFTSVNTIPVTLRSLVANPEPSTRFTDTLTGGNGRQPNLGQTVYYQVRIPAGLPVLNAQVTTPDRRNSFLAELVDPVTGEAASTAGNAQLSTTVRGPVLTRLLGTQLHVLHPAGGIWTLIVDFYGQVSGASLTQPIFITLDRTPALPAVRGLPDSTRTTLVRGRSRTVYLTIRNRGTTSEAYFVDARLDRSARLALVPSTQSTVRVPIPSTATLPEYLVPTRTTSVTARVAAAQPIFFDYLSAFGDPDLISSGPRPSGRAVGTLTRASITPGDWLITPFQAGPDGATGLAPVTAQTSMSVTTAAFDPSVSSPTGDLWLGSVEASATVNAVVVGPGQRVTVPVRISPDAPAGTVVRGVLYVDDYSVLTGLADQEASPGVHPGGSEVAALSYAYTVG